MRDERENEIRVGIGYFQRIQDPRERARSCHSQLKVEKQKQRSTLETRKTLDAEMHYQPHTSPKHLLSISQLRHELTM